MRVILHVNSGPSRGRQIPLQTGEIARFGRHSTADVCFPEDAEMSDVHFELHCHVDRCLLRDLGGSGGTLLNSQPITEVDLQSGDVIQAGKTSLSASIKGGPQEDNPEDIRTEVESTPEPITAAMICSQVDLSEESMQLLTAEHTPESFIDTLIEHRQFNDAIAVLSFCLPRHMAVQWAHRCIGDLLGGDLSPDDQAVMKANQNWLDDPSEEHRRAAMAAAEANEFQGVPCWVALAAFWSDGSIAPADLPEVKPDQSLTRQGVSAALLMTALHGDPANSDQRYQQILQVGKEILSQTEAVTI